MPFLGTCGGFQHAIIEYARNVMGWQDAAHAETDTEGRMVIAPLSCSLVEKSDTIELRAHTLIARAYGAIILKRATTATMVSPTALPVNLSRESCG